jgi:ATP-dependent DNA helicase PIF1
LRIAFQNVRLILVDEASFIGHNLLHAMSERLQEIQRVDEPFGGIHVVLFGDLWQLPPVSDTALYLQSNQTPDYFSDVRFYELTEVMRQRGDPKFAVALNNYAVGRMTPEDVQLLKSRETTLDKVPSTAHWLFFSNREVDEANLERLNDGESTTCPAFEFASSNSREENKQSLWDEAANLPRTKTNKLSLRLPLKVGARYMVTHNLDTSDGLVNGSVGILRRVEMGVVQNDRKTTVKRAWMEMEGERTGEKRRRQYSERAIRDNVPPNWTPVDRINKRVLTRGEDDATVHWKQLPLTVAEAMTVHKAQGSTFEECAAFLKPNMSRAMTYVALSRVKSLENLYIIGDFHPSAAVEGDDPISRALEWLRERVITSEEDAAVSQVLERLKESATKVSL